MSYLRPQDREKTAWRVSCPYHGLVYLTQEEYLAQLEAPNHLWECPAFDENELGVCGAKANWDSHWYEAWMEAQSQ